MRTAAEPDRGMGRAAGACGGRPMGGCLAPGCAPSGQKLAKAGPLPARGGAGALGCNAWARCCFGEAGFSWFAREAGPASCGLPTFHAGGPGAEARGVTAVTRHVAPAPVDPLAQHVRARILKGRTAAAKLLVVPPRAGASYGAWAPFSARMEASSGPKTRCQRRSSRKQGSHARFLAAMRALPEAPVPRRWPHHPPTARRRAPLRNTGFSLQRPHPRDMESLKEAIVADAQAAAKEAAESAAAAAIGAGEVGWLSAAEGAPDEVL